jgi:hypothetical protein
MAYREVTRLLLQQRTDGLARAALAEIALLEARGAQYSNEDVDVWGVAYGIARQPERTAPHPWEAAWVAHWEAAQ